MTRKTWKNRTAWTRGALAALLVLQAAGAATAGTTVPAAAQLVQAPTQMEAAYVRGIQKELLAHGYRPGPVDGVAGPQTRAAIRAYQRDAGLAASGVADKRLLDHLKFAQPKVYTFGQPVMGHALDLQRELARRNYYLGPHDGVAGPATLAALSRFQADAGLPQDNRVDGILVQKVRDAPAEIEAAPRAQAGAPAEDEFMEFVPMETPAPQAAPQIEELEDLEEQPEEPAEEKPDAETAPDFSDT